ncbi:MAG: putative system TPR-repeat lipoprotein [Hyphomicrobiales bacterium]|nr:putative system TPR-repeat lipoprotein [Hyphomicrobiales bacterium]
MPMPTRFFVAGRLRGLTTARLSRLLLAKGSVVTRSLKSADWLVLAHSEAARILQDDGSLAAPYAATDHRLLSEDTFRLRIALSERGETKGHCFADNAVASLGGISLTEVRGLALFDALQPVGGQFSFADLSRARRIRRWLDEGITLPEIVRVMHVPDLLHTVSGALDLVRLPSGSIGINAAGSVSQPDGQFELPLQWDAPEVEPLFDGAQIAEADGDLVEAARLYELASRLDPSDALVFYNLGNVLSGAGALPEADIAFRRALAIDPAFAEAWYNLGVLDEKRQRSELAAANYRQAVSHDPQFHDARYNLARLLSHQGNYAEALPQWERLANSQGLEERAVARRWATLCRLELQRPA